MKIHSKNINDTYLDNDFGKHGAQFLMNKKPNRSFHVAWEDLPTGTVSLALTLLDEDAIPVCGFTWIHWTVANIDPSLKELPENASIEMNLLEGLTSWSSGLLPEEWRLNKEEDAGFGGCAPPDKNHRYTLTVYAINKKLDLKKGFYKNELVSAMEGNIIEKKELHFNYRA